LRRHCTGSATSAFRRGAAGAQAGRPVRRLDLHAAARRPGLTAIVRDYSTNTVGAYWPPERRWVDLGYRGMPFPCADIEAPDFEIRLDLTLDDVLAYLRTWSSTQRCIKETGVDPCIALRETA
jgi:hypothetical protein